MYDDGLFGPNMVTNKHRCAHERKLKQKPKRKHERNKKKPNFCEPLKQRKHDENNCAVKKRYV